MAVDLSSNQEPGGGTWRAAPAFPQTMELRIRGKLPRHRKAAPSLNAIVQFRKTGAPSFHFTSMIVGASLPEKTQFLNVSLESSESMPPPSWAELPPREPHRIGRRLHRQMTQRSKEAVERSEWMPPPKPAVTFSRMRHSVTSRRIRGVRAAQLSRSNEESDQAFDEGAEGPGHEMSRRAAIAARAVAAREPVLSRRVIALSFSAPPNPS
jgi:hypothetical protein